MKRDSINGRATLPVPDSALITALDAASDGVVITDSDGKVVYINGPAESLTNWGHTEAINRPADEILLLHDHTSGASVGSATRELAGKQATGGLPARYTLLARNRQRIPVEVVLPKIDGKGEAGAHVYVLRHEIMSPKIEEEHRLRIVAEEANQIKERVLSMVAHELRNPLSVVMACAENIEETAQLSFTEHEEMEDIRRNAALMARLLNDLLEMSRNGREKFDLSLQEVDVHALMRRAVQECHNDINTKDLQISIELYAEQHLLQADEARLQQIIWNLLQNAIKFTPAGGRISIRSHNATPGRLQIEFEDTGIGIEPEALPHIFDLYRQAMPSISKKFGGWGIGLAVSRAIAEAHGGTLTATSSGADRGASFVLDLSTERSSSEKSVINTRAASAKDRSAMNLRHTEAIKSVRTDRSFDSAECGK
jgi:signal transduction histidine kinase